MTNQISTIPIGEDARPKDRIKQGISPHTVIEEMDCTRPKELITFIIPIKGTVNRLVTVQAYNLKEADTLALEEFCSLVGATDAHIVDGGDV
jgi:hypothetical protein